MSRHGRRSLRLCQRAALGGALMVAPAGCGDKVGQALHPAQSVRYTGALPGCGLNAATLSRHGDTIAFAPGDGVLVIQGSVAADNSFAGALNTQPPGKPPFVLTVHGMIGPETASVDYATPRCRSQTTLTRVHEALF